MHALQSKLTPKVVNALYTEAMLLADEARGYFDRDQREIAQGPNMPADVSVALSCESLKVTTRLMHCIAWLLNQKAVAAGEISELDAASEMRELGYAPASDVYQVARFPEQAREIIASSEDLYYRLQRLNSRVRQVEVPVPAPHAMIEKLRASF